MKNYIIILLLLSLYLPGKAQFGTSGDKRHIEVTGRAEIEIIPDEIYISITLRERYEGKEKITLEKQEDSLKRKLTLIGIDLKNLTLSDASSDYVKVHWRKKDALNSKDFQLKVATAEEVSKVFQALGELKINDAGISKVDHSRMEEFKKDLRIKAVKDAKDKAAYMLASINEQPGAITNLIEIGANEEDKEDFNTDSWRGVRYTAPATYSWVVKDSNGDSATRYPEVDFQKIKLNYQVQATFEIK